MVGWSSGFVGPVRVSYWSEPESARRPEAPEGGKPECDKNQNRAHVVQGRELGCENQKAERSEDHTGEKAEDGDGSVHSHT